MAAKAVLLPEIEAGLVDLFEKTQTCAPSMPNFQFARHIDGENA